MPAADQTSSFHSALQALVMRTKRWYARRPNFFGAVGRQKVVTVRRGFELLADTG